MKSMHKWDGTQGIVQTSITPIITIILCVLSMYSVKYYTIVILANHTTFSYKARIMWNPTVLNDPNTGPNEEPLFWLTQ